VVIRFYCFMGGSRIDLGVYRSRRICSLVEKHFRPKWWKQAKCCYI